MEFNEKLQVLRRQREITQEELAQALFVSRTAVSKWESGRGYPSIDSLKQIASFFSVSIDDLLSGEEFLSAAEEDIGRKGAQLCDRILGLLDCSTVLLMFVPIFGQKYGDLVQHVSLLRLTDEVSHIRTSFAAAILGMIICGILNLFLQTSENNFWTSNKQKVSLVMHSLCLLLFIICRQAYVASFLLMLLTIKIILLFKQQ